MTPATARTSSMSRSSAATATRTSTTGRSGLVPGLRRTNQPARVGCVDRWKVLHRLAAGIAAVLYRFHVGQQLGDGGLGVTEEQGRGRHVQQFNLDASE